MRQEMKNMSSAVWEILGRRKISEKFGKVHPAFCGEYQFADLRKITNELSEAFIEGMGKFWQKDQKDLTAWMQF